MSDTISLCAGVLTTGQEQAADGSLAALVFAPTSSDALRARALAARVAVAVAARAVVALAAPRHRHCDLDES